MITGFDTLTFAREISAAQEIYGKFDQQFTEGTLLSWATSHLDHEKAECLDIANCYFIPKQNTGGLSSVSVQEEVDPYRVLVDMAAGNAVYFYVHTDNNQVQYFTTLKGVGAHCSVKIDNIPVPSKGQNSTIYPLAADWAHGRRDPCGLTRLPVHVGPL